MLTHFLLVRHGETDWNKEKRCQGWTDIPLNETGLAQAEKISKQLKKGDYSALYTSDLKRAFQTAEVLNETLSLSIQKVKELRELNHGDAEGKKDIRQIYGDILAIMYDNTHPNGFDIRLPSGESRNDVLARLLPFLRKVAEKHKGENILLVSHGNLILSLYLAFHKNDFIFKNGDALKFSYDSETDIFFNFEAFSFNKE
ncbi:MAG: histidine phosphatase family protein [Alphaproteobacteria bacterium]|nr:histidine phosphatase family protein [Alphaproteobacteria bacterium]